MKRKIVILFTSQIVYTWDDTNGIREWQQAQAADLARTLNGCTIYGYKIRYALSQLARFGFAAAQQIVDLSQFGNLSTLFACNQVEAVYQPTPEQKLQNIAELVDTALNDGVLFTSPEEWVNFPPRQTEWQTL